MDAFFNFSDVRQTLRTLWFGEQISSSDVFSDGQIELKQLFLKGLSDSGKSCLEGDFGGAPRDEDDEIARA